nr:uncharacterized mitochondrial protein AtMg00810-like [Tanacetum cinerariifolium]
TPSIGFIRPFGCHVTILHTLDPLVKLDGKADGGFLVGYSISSTAIRVINSRTRIVQETLHINFLENQPNVAGSRPTWLFDIDTLTKSMNYQPGIAGYQPNPSAGIQKHFDADKAGEGNVQQYVLFPLWSTGSKDPQNTDADTTFEVKEHESKVHVSPSSSAKTKKHDDKTKNMPALEEITYSDDEEVVGAEVDFSNLETNINVSPIPTTRVHKDHPVTQIISDLSLAPQTRSMKRMVKEQGGLTQINDYDFHTCMFACFLSQEEPKREEGIDYEEIFAPVARIEAIRLFLAYASFMGFMVYQMDVKSAFLYETIKKEVYVCQPLGFEDPDYPDKVYKVVKAFYGLHHAPRTWLMIGSLMYLTSSRLDIMFAICACARFQVTLKASHLHAIKRIFRYLRGKPHLGLWYPKDSPFNLVAYSDSDYAGASLDRKSTTGGCQFLDASEGFDQIIDFLNASSIKYALTVNPNIYVSCIKQFWSSNSVKKVNDVLGLQDLIDRKKVIITEATIREALRLDDAESVDCLRNEEIFIELSMMGYEKPSTKLTFYKAFFSPQWKVETPLFEGMIVAQQADDIADEVAAGVDINDVPSADAEPSLSLPTPTTQPPPPSQELPSTSQVIPTSPPSPIIAPSSPPQQQQPSQPTHDAEILLDLLHTLLETCTTLTMKVEALEQDKVAQAFKIIKLKHRVKKLERKSKLKVLGLRRLRNIRIAQRAESSADNVMDDQEDASKQGEIIVNIDADDDVTLKDGAAVEKNLEHTEKVLSMQDDKLESAKLKEVVEVVTTAKLMTEVVTAVAATITAATTLITVATITAAPSAARRRKGAVIRDPEETATPSIIIHSEPKFKDKGKGILVEEPKPLKKQAQIEHDEAYARELEAELNKNINKDGVIEQVSRKEKEDNVMLRYQALKRKPQTKAQARKNMMIYLKNMDGFKMDYFKGMSYNDIRPIFEKYFNLNVAFLKKTKEQLEEEKSIALKRTKRIYPLTRFTLDQMLNNVQLKVEEESKVSLELLRFISFGVDAAEDFKKNMLINEAVTLHPIDPELLKIDVAPLASKSRNNRTTHTDYLRHTQEETPTLREIVKSERLLNPLNTSLDYASIRAIGPPRPFKDGWHNSSIVRRSGTGGSAFPLVAISKSFKRVGSTRDLLQIIITLFGSPSHKGSVGSSIDEIGDFMSELCHHGGWKVFSKKHFSHLLNYGDRIPWQTIKPSGGMMCQGVRKEIQTKGVIGDPIHFDTLGDVRKFVKILVSIVPQKSMKLARILGLLDHIVLKSKIHFLNCNQGNWSTPTIQSQLAQLLHRSKVGN